jgi:hypothetical protein
MIELSNTNAQVLAPGQSATFDIVILHTGCAECHRNNSGAIALTQKNAIYELSYNANIGATAAGDAQLGLSLDSTPLPETNAITVTATAGDLANVSASTFVRTCCCGNGGIVTLTNTGTTTINLAANSRLSIKRIA